MHAGTECDKQISEIVSGFPACLTSKVQEEERDCSCAHNRPMEQPTGPMKIGNDPSRIGTDGNILIRMLRINLATRQPV